MALKPSGWQFLVPYANPLECMQVLLLHDHGIPGDHYRIVEVSALAHLEETKLPMLRSHHGRRRRYPILEETGMTPLAQFLETSTADYVR